MGRGCRDDAGAHLNIGRSAIGLALDLRDPLPVSRFLLPAARYPLPVTRYPLPVTRCPGLPTTNFSRERTLDEAQNLEGCNSGQALGH